MSAKSKYPLIFLILVSFIFLDQITKQWAAQSLQNSEPLLYLGGLVRVLYAENTGAWGNLGSDWEGWLRWLFLLGLPALLLLGLFIYLLVYKSLVAFEVVAYALILAGGVGNLIDRFTRGYVIDFLYVGYGRIGTNIFNIADAIIMAGFIMLVLKQLKESWEKRKQEKQLPPSEPSH